MKNTTSKPLSWLSAFLFWTTCVLVSLCYLSVFINPLHSVYIAFFGLAYPLIALLLIVGLLFTLLQRRWKRLGILVLLMLIGYPLHTRYFSLGSQSKPVKGEKTISVMTYNVRLFDFYNWVSGKKHVVGDSIISFLKEKNPDIVCFQEFYYEETKRFPTKDTLVKILNAKHFQGKFTFVDVFHINQYFGVATLSRYPIVKQGFVPIHSAVSNFCIYSDVEIEHKIIRVYNVHVGSFRFEKEEYAVFDEKNTLSDSLLNKSNLLRKLITGYKSRSEELALVVEHVKKSPYPVILCGDINDTPISYAYQQLSDVLNDAFTESGFGLGHTYSGKLPSNRIDYIFHSAEFTSHTFHVQEKVWSDHRAIWATLGFKP